MAVNVGKEVAAMQRMTVGELRTKFAEVYGEPTTARHREWLIKRIAWRLQAVAEGDLTERARARAAELANDADLRLNPPKAPPAVAPVVLVGPKQPVDLMRERRLPPPGTIIVREYKGRRIEVMILAGGFEFEGDIYKSLSAVAKAATGQHLNGYHFFRIDKEAV